MKLIPFHPDHVRTLALQENQMMVAPLLANPAHTESLIAAGPSFTAIEGDRVIGAGGIVNQWEGRAIAWTLLDRHCGRYMLAVHREAIKFLDSCHLRRIEAHIDVNFAAAHRWAVMLGFRPEGVMKAFTPDGRDCWLYARIQSAAPEGSP